MGHNLSAVIVDKLNVRVYKGVNSSVKKNCYIQPRLIQSTSVLSLYRSIGNDIKTDVFWEVHKAS